MLWPHGLPTGAELRGAAELLAIAESLLKFGHRLMHNPYTHTRRPSEQ